MKLCLITDDVAFARDAERAGVDRIMIDLEHEGKVVRQAGRGLFQSTHGIDAVAPMRRALRQASLLVRINPLSAKSADEIETVLAAGATC